jgi:NhaP-type Na+/H+ or K+/H+ antiporter
MAAGVMAQALARHARLPGIVVLLAVGVLMGPDVANLVRPASMGSGLQAFVGFAVAIILFEGGLHMNLKKLRSLAKPIRRLVTIGALVTAAGGAIAAKVFMPWDWRLSILFGTLVIVTGPTVITPLLRRLRIAHGVGLVLEAEGIFIDAVGATVAVVALEVALVPSTQSAAAGILDVALRLGVGAAVGLAGGAILALGLRWRNIIPDGLEKLMTLSFAVAVFQVSNAVVHESGITAAIVAGMVLSNSYSHAFDEIVEFKEQLTVLLIATLFVLLAADVRIDDIIALGKPGLLTVVALMFIVRPITVTVSSWGTKLTIRERVFLSWLAPRGIVAAAVASLFAISLDEAKIPGGTEMRALVFLVIAITVTVQGLTGGPLASMLRLRLKSNFGYLFLGANKLVRTIGGLLRDAGQHVVLIDSNQDACLVAEREGFEVIRGNGLEPHLLEHADADSRAAVVGLTPNETVNFLFTRKVRDLHRSPEIVVGLETEASGVTDEMVK